jgi:hypothetical protein
MPVHDWTRVDAGIFHAFHTVWTGNIQTALNSGILPTGFYALTEQHAGAAIADVLTLHAGAEPLSEFESSSSMGTAVAEAPPRVRARQTVDLALGLRRRTVSIRHKSRHRLIAMIEIVSPANKDRVKSVEAFAAKATDAVRADVNLLVIDLFPPGRHDPFGMTAAIRQQLEEAEEPAPQSDRPPSEPLTLSAFDAGPPIDIYLEYLAVGSKLPVMPLFLRQSRYINVPLEETYDAAYRGMPDFWREVLEGKRAAPQP